MKLNVQKQILPQLIKKQKVNLLWILESEIQCPCIPNRCSLPGVSDNPMQLLLDCTLKTCLQRDILCGDSSFHRISKPYGYWDCQAPKTRPKNSSLPTGSEPEKKSGIASTHVSIRFLAPKLKFHCHLHSFYISSYYAKLILSMGLYVFKVTTP